MISSRFVRAVCALCALTFIGKTRAATEYVVATIRSSDPTSNAITGTVTFSQDTTSSSTADVDVTWDIAGLTDGEHGFHVHDFGDITNISLITTGYHFTPSEICPVCNGTDTTCQAERDLCESDAHQGWPPEMNRHPGDMGNITSSSSSATGSRTLGQGKMSLSDNLRSIVGRAVSIHANPDNGEDPWGNAGAQVAWGVAGIANPDVSSSGTQTTNGAMPPFSSHVSSIVCSFNDNHYTLWTSDSQSVHGTILFEKAEIGASSISVYVELEGLSAGTKSFHFHEWGDLRSITTSSNPPNVGSVYSPNGNALTLDTISVPTSDSIFRTELSYTSGTFDLSTFVGRSLSIHDGATTASNTIAISVCGLTNEATTTKVTLGFPDDSNNNGGNGSSSDDDDDGLSAGSVFAIVLVVVLVIAAVGGFTYLHMVNVNKETDAGGSELATQHQTEDNTHDDGSDSDDEHKKEAPLKPKRVESLRLPPIHTVQP